MRKILKKFVCVMTLAAMAVAAFPVAKARAAMEDEFGLNAKTKYLYVNAEARYPKAKYNKSEFDFDFTKHPVRYLEEYKFKWYSEKPQIASVKVGGIVTALSPGTTKIFCDITSKATGEVITVTATVIVRKNASSVKITNADEYNGKKYSAGDVIDLNRTMYNEKGVGTTTRTGRVVTDRTMWTYEPYDGTIKVNQNNGKYTITDKSSGTYKLYCYTYQSDDHDEPIVKSNKVSIKVVK